MGVTGRKFALLEDEGGVELDYQAEKIIDAEDCSFLSVGYTSTDSKSAIIESQSSALAKSRFTLTCIMNGNVSNGDYITYSNLTPNARILIPEDSQLDELTFSNTNSSADFDFKIYKNGRPGTLLETLEVRNGQHGSFVTLNHTYNAGDFVDIEYIDQGTNANDLTVVLFFSRLDT